MRRPWGMSKPAFLAYIQACMDAKVNPDRVVQTVGNAIASKGLHKADGILNSEPYCAAVDLSVAGLSIDQIRRLLAALARNGFAGWYRYTGSFAKSRHIHAVYAGLPMKAALRNQVLSYLDDRNGLKGNGRETFYTAPPEDDARIRALFERANGGK